MAMLANRNKSWKEDQEQRNNGRLNHVYLKAAASNPPSINELQNACYLLQSVDGPHGHVGDEEEGDQLAARLVSALFRCRTAAPPRVDYK